jgi:hypothetical protein
MTSEEAEAIANSSIPFVFTEPVVFLLATTLTVS